MNIEDPVYLRELCRNNNFVSKTSGLCLNYIHANIIILPLNKLKINFYNKRNGLFNCFNFFNFRKIMH